MTDFEPPSFSLGLDFDLDSEPQYDLQPDPVPDLDLDPLVPQPQPSSSAVPQYDDDDFEAYPSGPGQDSSVLDPPRTLKRLRRGLTLPARKSVSEVDCLNLDEDIEDFSSQEEDNPKDDSATQCHSFASSSKLPLHRLGVLTSQSTHARNLSNKKEFPNSLGSANIGSRRETPIFPKITGSPLRRFQLIDSDSDSDFTLDETANNIANRVNLPKSDKYRNGNIDLEEKKTNPVSNGEDLWKDFSLEKSFHIPTPAFDEACEEYFRSLKDNNQAQTKSKECFQISNLGKNSMQQRNLGPLPPAHCYFFHEDPRIQKLVRDRLPNFSPLGTTINQGYQQHDASVIDYTSQFGQGEGSKQATKRPKAALNSTPRGRKNAKNTRGKEISQESGNWVNPKSCAGVPKDAGQRRVQAAGKSAGQWFTDSNGRKVYVTTDGKEMSGRGAYIHYRKESGAGFKSKKKTTTKKKSAAKKK